MADRTMTLVLPQGLFEQLQARAQRHGRPVEDEAAQTLATTILDETLPASDLAPTVVMLAGLDDMALWRISRSQPTVEDGILLDVLVDRRRRGSLTEAEEQMLTELIDRHDRVMVLRAEAVALLQARGNDVSELVARA